MRDFALMRGLGLTSVLALLVSTIVVGRPVSAQQPASAAKPGATAAVSQRGTIKSINGAMLTLSPDTGDSINATVSDTTRLLQIAPGSTDLKSAQTIQLTDIAVGDRVLITGRPAEAGNTMAASRVILMKAVDITQRRTAEQADWQRRGSGGIVTAVDGSAGTIGLSNGQRKIEVGTSGTTVFRRYAGDSVRFEDAQPGTLAQIQPGDQVRVRGAKSSDGASILAEEIVSGSFRNLAGTIVTVDPSGSSVTVKDLAAKKNVVVRVTANSEVRKLPPEMAARFAARSRTSQTGAQGGASTAESGPSRVVTARPPSAGEPPAGAGPGSGRGTGSGQGNIPGSGLGSGNGNGPGSGNGAGRSAGGDLSQLVARLPQGTISELKPGDAVMVVASLASAGAGTLTAITMLSGVEPILAATPTGTPAVTLSPWSVGSGAPEGAGGG